MNAPFVVHFCCYLIHYIFLFPRYQLAEEDSAAPNLTDELFAKIFKKNKFEVKTAHFSVYLSVFIGYRNASLFNNFLQAHSLRYLC